MNRAKIIRLLRTGDAESIGLAIQLAQGVMGMTEREALRFAIKKVEVLKKDRTKEPFCLHESFIEGVYFVRYWNNRNGLCGVLHNFLQMEIGYHANYTTDFSILNKWQCNILSCRSIMRNLLLNNFDQIFEHYKNQTT